MVGMSAGDISISSWGWTDADNRACERAEAVFRVWSCRSTETGAHFYISLPDEWSSEESFVFVERAIMQDKELNH